MSGQIPLPMQIDVSPIYRGEKELLAFSFSFEPVLARPDIAGGRASVDGEVREVASGQTQYVELSMHIRFPYCARCARCDCETKNVFDQTYRFGVVPSLENASDMDLETQDGTLELGALCESIIILEMPGKVLCKPDCLGLCAGCGADLNREPCRCKPTSGDERFAVLKKLLDKEQN